MRKKHFTIIVAALVIATLALLFGSLKSKPSLKSETKEITYDELNTTLRSSNTDFLLYIGRDDCGDCSTFEPLLIEYLSKTELKLPFYYLDVKLIRKEGKEQWNKFKSNNFFDQTPVIQFYHEGRLDSKIEWSESGIPVGKLNAWLDHFKKQS